MGGRLAAYRAYYVVYWCASAVITPYLGIFYRSIGFDGMQIGAFSSIYALFFLISGSAIGYIADRGVPLRLLLVLSACSGVAGALLIFLAEGKLAALLPGLFLLAACLASPSPIVDNLLIISLGPDRFRYSRFRRYGPLGFAIGSVICSNAISVFGTACILYIYLLAMAVLAAVYFWLPIPAAAEERRERKPGGHVRLNEALSPAFLCILASLWVWGICEQGMFQYLNLLIVERWDDIGISGIISSATMAGEFIAYGAMSALLRRKISTYLLLAAGFILALVQFIGISFAASPYMLVPLLFLGGAGFPFLWSSATDMLHSVVPASVINTCRELCSAMVSGAGAITGGLAYGFVYSRYGLETAYGLSFLIPVVGLLVSFILWRIMKMPDAKMED